MKLIRTILLAVLTFSAAHAQNFTKVPGAASDVAVALNGSVYVVGTSKRVFKWNTSKKNWDTFYEAGRQAKFINAQNGFVQTVNERGQLYSTDTQGKSSRFVKSLGSGLKDFGQNGAMILTTGIALNQPAKDVKQTMADAPVNIKVAAVNEHRMYVIKKDNSIWLCQRNKKGVKLPGKALDIAYDAMKKKVYVIGTSRRIFVWNASRRNWDTVRHTRNDFANLAVNNGVIWATTAKGDIYTTASTSGSTSKAGVYKLKITLNHLISSTSMKGRNDMYLLRFNPNLKISNKSYNLKNKKYTRIGSEIQRYGLKNQLYISRKRNETDFDKVLLKRDGSSKITINNSGIFEIPKNIRLTDSNTDFQLSVVLLEVSKSTETLVNETVKLNLSAILDYLLGKKPASSFEEDMRRVGKTRKLGIGYQSMVLTSQSGKRYIEDGFRKFYDGSAFKLYSKDSFVDVVYSLELVD